MTAGRLLEKHNQNLSVPSNTSLGCRDGLRLICSATSRLSVGTYLCHEKIHLPSRVWGHRSRAARDHIERRNGCPRPDFETLRAS